MADINLGPLLWACFFAGVLAAALVFGIGKVIVDHLNVGVH